MNIIIPMAGLGKRLRPHTLTIPKPLLPVAGKPIVQRLVEEIATVTNEKIDKIGFVTGRFGTETENHLLSVATAAGASGSIHYQDEALGTAHAILCAQALLKGKTMVAYADTLFRASFKMDTSKANVIWVSQVEHPEQFGVVKLDKSGSIEGFYEKPKAFVSDLAIIGIYYFNDGTVLRDELQYLLDKKITSGGEYGITDALQNMMTKGQTFHIEKVDKWMDCGNKEAWLEANAQVLDYLKDDEDLISAQAELDEAVIIEPCFIDSGVKISQSIIGPYVAIGKNSVITNTIMRNAIVQQHAMVENKLVENSIIGNFAQLKGNLSSYNIGDYNHIADDISQKP
jgi:glucose-1-phosphate thymidylyltransferase